MENIFNNRIIESYFYSRNGIITEINEEFLNFTGFKMNELLGKSLMEIGNMLRINSHIFQKEGKD